MTHPMPSWPVRAPAYGSAVVIWEPMCMCMPIIVTLGVRATTSARARDRSMSIPNFDSFLPVEM